MSAHRVRRPPPAGRAVEGLPLTPLIGATLGPYRIDAELGAGGMGAVFLASDTRRVGRQENCDTRVALKLIHAHLLSTPGFFKRFLREVEIGKRVRHENVVATLDVDAVEIDGKVHHFLVMEYVEGQTLRALVTELDRVPEELCRHIGRQVAKGLAAIHRAGVVHRDIKPENVLITRDHVVKVMDLGVARLNDEALRLSQTGAFVGSIHYAAPECFSESGRHVDGRADLHALGLVLYELSCGTNPYYAESVPEILKKVLHEAPRRLGDVNPQLSPFFEEVVHCLLAKRPADRFADATTLHDVLSEGEDSAWWRSRANSIRAVTHRPLRRIRIPRETAVYGRDADIAKLRGLFEKAKSGEGQVVLIEGEAGIGKSRVVDEWIGRLQRDGEDLDFLFGSYPPGGAATAAGAFSTAFREQFGDAGLADSLRDRLGPAGILAPAFAAVLLGSAAPAGAHTLTKESLQTCFVAAVRSLGAERTTVLLIDDLHFATEDARSLFTSLAMAAPGHRVMLVGTTRPGIDEKWLAGLTRLPQTSQMALHRLGPKDLAALLKDTLKSETLALSLAGQIGVKSDGNPFFVFEIIRGLRDGQFLTQKDDGTWVSTRVIEDIKIPSSILDLVNARVADLTQDERNVLDVAACWGFEFDPLLVADVLGLAQIPLMRSLAQIEKKHRLVRSAGRRFVFDHHQVQEALYGAMPELLREPYHAALANALETRAKCADKDPATIDGALCVDLCAHFLKGAQGAGAARYLSAALEHLEKGCLNAQAAALAERALAEPGLLAGAHRAKTLLRLASGPLDRLSRRPRQEEAAREAERLAEAAGDDELRGQAAHALGWSLYQTSRYPDAESSYRRSQEIARSRGDKKAEIAAEGGLGNCARSEGRLREAQEHHECHLAFSRVSGDVQGEASGSANLGSVFFSQGRHEEARAHMARHLAISREVGDRHGEAAGTGNLGIVSFAQGRLGEARDHMERCLAINSEIGDRRGESHAMGNLGGVLLCEGRLVEARERFERHLAISREIGDRRGEAIALYNLGKVLLESGEPASSKEWFLAALALSEECGFGHFVAATQLALGDLHRESGEEPLARQWLTKSRDESSKQGYVGEETLARIHLACLTGGRRETVRGKVSYDPPPWPRDRPQDRRDTPQEGHVKPRSMGLEQPGDMVKDAEESFKANEGRLSADERLAALFLLWKAGGERGHLTEAKRLLDEAVANVPDDIRASMLANVRLNREITAAAKTAGL